MVSLSARTERLKLTIRGENGELVEKDTILLELRESNSPEVGYGEVVLAPVLGQSLENALDDLNRVSRSAAFRALNPHDLQLLHALASSSGVSSPVRNGLDVAFNDLRAKILGVPFHVLIGLDATRSVKTAFTLERLPMEYLEQKVSGILANGYTTIKIKLGPEQPRDYLSAIRICAPNAKLWVDMNRRFDADEAKFWISEMNATDVTLCEEPLAAGHAEDDYVSLKRLAEFPLIADESCWSVADVWRGLGKFDGVNIKLPKMGGVDAAILVANVARSLGQRIMLGCYSCTSVTIAATAQLVPLCDFADLDGALLLQVDSFETPHLQNGSVSLANTPGIGVTPRSRR